MGIPGLFAWVRKNCPHLIRSLPSNKSMSAEMKHDIENLCLDMNGIFHEACQKVYKYGNYAVVKSKIHPEKALPPPNVMRKRVFQEVGNIVNNLVYRVRPTRRVLIMVDGPAGNAKQSQQRQRRYRSVQDKDRKFDSNCISPGTEWMDFLSKYMDQFIRREITNNPMWRSLHVIFSNEKVAGEGEHKCFKRGTLILLMNGKIKKIEDILVGDVLIGDDGTPRTVTSLVTGEDEMYEIKQTEGITYTVNKGHILSLKISGHKKFYWSDSENAWVVSFFDRTEMKHKRKQFSGNRDEAKVRAEAFLLTIDDDDVLDISVSDYLKLSERTRKFLYGYKCKGVEWTRKDVTIDPYILGLWLGDGTASGSQIATTDDPIREYIQRYCDENEFKMTFDGRMSYRICTPRYTKNMFLEWLNQYNLVGNKHIPNDYITNDRQTRLSLLAGLIDTDGNVVHNGRMIRFSQCEAHGELFDGVVYLARSLGFKCCVRNFDSTFNGKRYPARNVTISGDIHLIPTLLDRKKCTPPPGCKDTRKVTVDPLRTSIQVSPVGKGEYFGINTDGNRRFLLGDFTVVHNCMNFIRKHGTSTESYVLYGLDADLIMLTLSTQNMLATGQYALHPPKFYILREDQYSRTPTLLIVDITMFRDFLIQELTWGLDCSRNSLINDYIFLCFLLGNDFLPHSPTVDLIEGGLELLFVSYSGACAKYNRHLMKEGDMGPTFDREVLKDILCNIAMSERIILEDSVKRGDKFADPLLQRYITYVVPSPGDVTEDVEEVDFVEEVDPDVDAIIKAAEKVTIAEEAPDAFLEAPEEFVDDDAEGEEKDTSAAAATPATPAAPERPRGVPQLNFDMYRTEYYSSKFPRQTPAEVCHEYLRGMEWVYRYYTTGIPSWTWTYPFFYAPFAKEMMYALDSYKSKSFQLGRPMEPFRQLLSILPPQSKDLLPPALHPVIEKFPADAKVDLAGKKFEWQGVVLVPPLLDFDREYRDILDQMPIAEKRRNFLGKEYAYRYRPDLTYVHKTYYGEFQCSTEVTVFE